MTLSPALDPLALAEAWMSQGRKIALATVVSTWGSAPRPAGSHLLVDSDGNFEGSVSGGCVETDVIATAIEAIETGRGHLLEFGVADETAWRVGLTCGGRIRVHVEVVTDLCALKAVNAARALRAPCLQLIDVAGARSRFLADAGAAAGDIEAVAVSALRAGRPGSVMADDREVFVNPYMPPPRLVVVGAVHIAQLLLDAATRLGWNTVLIDPRSAFATPDRFPGTQLMIEWPQDALDALGLDRRTALVALSHNPDIDDAAIGAALTAGCFYVGALGSRKTHGRRTERLLAAGVPADAMACVHAPIGLPIGAETPEEIAIAILAEVIGVLRAG